MPEAVMSQHVEQEKKIRVCKLPPGGDPYCIYVVPAFSLCEDVKKDTPYHIDRCKPKKDNKK